MYKVTYTVLGIIAISLFFSQTHGDEINVEKYLQNIPKFKSGDIKKVQASQFKRQIPKIVENKCILEKRCKSAEKNLNSNSRNNFAKYNQKPIIDLVPPAATSKDYYTYFNRRKKALKNKNDREDIKQPHLQKSTIKSRKNSVNNTVEEEISTSYIRDHAPAYVTEVIKNSKENSQNQTKHDNNPEETSSTNLSQISPDRDRIEFQIQGHEGPKTYIFGFDTGVGKNRQYRLEERLNDGTVKGHYGYYDARGKLRTVKYIAKPIEGYQEKHHETIIFGGKN